MVRCLHYSTSSWPHFNLAPSGSLNLDAFTIFPSSIKSVEPDPQLANSIEIERGMAPTIGIATPDPMSGKLGLGFRSTITEVEELRRRNLELEREVRERQEREEEMRQELERTKGRLMAVEEAEERLCAQLGELEAEAIEQARDYNRRIKELSDRLLEARRWIEAAGGMILAADGSR